MISVSIIKSDGTKHVLSTATGEVRTVAGQVVPSGVRQTKITDHVTNLPPYLLQQMYAG